MPNGAPEAKLQPLEGAPPLNLPHLLPRGSCGYTIQRNFVT